MALFRESTEFAPTLDAAAERLGISPTAVEKDYWVSQALRALGTRFADDFVFKGGTSLSKCFGIIERFSEDIDVLVLKHPGRGVDAVMKGMRDAVSEAFGGDYLDVRSGKREHRTSSIDYPAIRPQTGLIQTRVLLEMGIRGGEHPHELHQVGSLLGDVLEREGVDLTDFDDLGRFSVQVLHPGRTLIEKLVLVNDRVFELGIDPGETPDVRDGRHFYDIHELLDDARALSIFSDSNEMASVIASIEEVSARFHRRPVGVPCRPEGGFATSAAFDPSTPVSQVFRRSYELTMPELHFGAGPLPTWEQVCDRVRSLSDLL